MCNFVPDLDSIMVTRLSQYGTMIGLSLWIVLLSACSPRALHEAQSVVTQADSMWANGQPYSDSAQLAQAYETLSSFNSPLLSILNARLTTDFAHAGYHYGRLLRNHDDPVVAMQVFIETTHSRTDDYHILGRIYSNMGSICHLAGEYPLSYDMYEKSANLFLKNGDTLLYYYGLNNMAFELAEQGKKEDCYFILKDITGHCSTDSLLLAYCYMSQAQACLRCQQYDSMILYAHQSGYYYPSLTATTMQLAQAYSHIGEKDSATYYANQVLATSNALSDINNALYILTNDDETKDQALIRQTAAKRADTHKLLAFRQGELSQAVQLLQQDLNRKPDWRWLYTLLAVVLFTATTGVLIYLWHKRSQHRQMIHDIHAKEQEQMHLTNEIDALSNIQEERHHQIRADIEEACRIIRNSEDIKAQLCWNDYNKMCKLINTHFYGLADKLKTHPTMTENDVRMCILVLLDFSYEKIANILNLSPKSIAKLKSLTAHKLGTTMKNLRGKLMQIACQNMELK